MWPAVAAAPCWRSNSALSLAIGIGFGYRALRLLNGCADGLDLGLCRLHLFQLGLVAVIRLSLRLALAPDWLQRCGGSMANSSCRRLRTDCPYRQFTIGPDTRGVTCNFGLDLAVRVRGSIQDSPST